MKDSIGDPVIRKSPLFSGLSGQEFSAVAVFLDRCRVKKGGTIFNEGDAGEDMFILLSGAVNAFASQSDGTQRWMFDIKPGDFFGEMSVIAREPRSATLSAKEDTELMTLHGIDFYRIIFERPMIGVKILRAIGAVQNQWLDQSSKSYNDLMRWGETARRRAITDELTGLYNRRFLEESIKNRFDHGSVGLRKMSLLMMDLDKVHAINEKYGFLSGDRVIIAVAGILRSCTRSGDIAARLSGDEFSVLLPDTEGSNAKIIADRIRQNVQDRQVEVFKSPGSTENVSIDIRGSIGIAEAPTHAGTVEALIFAADGALRKAKNLGRNRVEMAS
jgi:diguanylate cyclase (GGDEF)-like protein